MYSKDEELKKRNRENLVEINREELLKIIEGHNCAEIISTGTVRRRLREEGILQKIGSKYTVTELGREMLSEEASKRLVQSRGGGEG